MEVKRLQDLNGQKIVIPLHKVRVIENCSINREIVTNADYCGVSFRNFKNFSMSHMNKGKIHFVKKFYCPTNNGYVIAFGKQIFDKIKKYYNSNKSISFVEIDVMTKMVSSHIGPLPNYDNCRVYETDISYEADDELEKWLDSFIESKHWYKNKNFIDNLGEMGFDISKIISEKREESIDSVLKD